MKLSPWMLSVTTFVVTVALCSTYAARVLFPDSASTNAPRLTTATSGDTDERWNAANADEPGADRPPAVMSSPTSVQTVPVLLTDLQPGSRIDAKFIGEAPISRSRITRYADTVLSADVLIGRLAREKLRAASPLRLSMLYPADRKPEVRIPPDLRLVSLRFSGQSGLIGQYLQSGSYVDVLLTDMGEPVRQPTVRRLFDGVRVYDVIPTQSAETPWEVILELTPQEQLTLMLAERIGKLTLTYNPAGPGPNGLTSQQQASEVRLQDFLARLSDARPPTTSRPPTATAPDASRSAEVAVEHFRNGERTQATFAATPSAER